MGKNKDVEEKVKRKRGRPRKPVFLDPLISQDENENALFDFVKWFLKTNHLLRKEIPEDQKSEDCLEHIVSGTVYLLADNPGGLTEQLKNNSETPPIKLALAILRFACQDVDDKYAKSSKEILRAAGLGELIPGQVTHRIANRMLEAWKHDPEDLFELVARNKAWIQGFIEKPLASKGNQKRIRDAFFAKFKKPMPVGLLHSGRDYEDRISERHYTIALAFISYEYGVPYEGLKSLYHDLGKKVRRDSDPEPIIREIEALSKKRTKAKGQTLNKIDERLKELGEKLAELEPMSFEPI